LRQITPSHFGFQDKQIGDGAAGGAFLARAAFAWLYCFEPENRNRERPFAAISWAQTHWKKSCETAAGMVSIFPMCLRSNILRYLAVYSIGFRVELLHSACGI
jgi:hypothetical protein